MKKPIWAQLPAVANDIEIAGQRFARLRAQKKQIVRYNLMEGYRMEVVDLDSGMLQPSVIVCGVLRSMMEHPERWARVRDAAWGKQRSQSK